MGEFDEFYKTVPEDQRGTYAALLSNEEATRRRCELVAGLLKGWAGVSAEATLSVLDVGCGYGDLKHYLPSNLKYTGSEREEWVYSECLKLHPSAEAGAFILGDVIDTDLFPAGSYDAVVALGVLATVPKNDLTAFMCRLSEVSRSMVLVSFLREAEYHDDEGLVAYSFDVIREASKAADLTVSCTISPPLGITSYALLIRN